MGRGRAKAKQTKVARELKYSSGGTDLDALRKELAGAAPAPAAPNGGSSGSHGPSSAFDDDVDEDGDDLGDSYGASTR